MQVKSLALLEQTECVIHDDLASLDGLARCKPDTEVVYVGKRGGMPSPKQSEICKLLVQKCQECDHVRYLIYSVTEHCVVLLASGVDADDSSVMSILFLLCPSPVCTCCGPYSTQRNFTVQGVHRS